MDHPRDDTGLPPQRGLGDGTHMCAVTDALRIRADIIEPQDKVGQ
jgi:hypothetical protein